MSNGPIRVFISYAWDLDNPEHRDQVRALAELLRSNGIEVSLDLWAQATPSLDWPAWVTQQLREVDFVIVVASPAYKRRAEGLADPNDGRGVVFEAAMVRDLVVGDRSEWSSKIITVLLPGATVHDIPQFLGPHSRTRYGIKDLTSDGLERVLRVLTGQAKYQPPPLGTAPVLSPAPLASRREPEPGTLATVQESAMNHRISNASNPDNRLARMLSTPEALTTNRIVTSQLFAIASVIGRDSLLSDLTRVFSNARRAAGAPTLQVLTGIGGIGKSSLARAYGMRNQYRYNLIWWIRSETSELATEDFRALLVTLGVSDVQRLEQPIQVAHLILANREGRWLLVFDNVPRQSSLRGLVPPEGAGDVIVTSRTQSWSDPKLVVTVPPLSDDAGAGLLCDTSRDDDVSAAQALVEELGGLPLALHQAGSYVAENPIGLAEYLQLYRQHRPRLNRLGLAPDYDLRVGTVWEVSFQMIPEHAQTVLNVLAWLGPDITPLNLLLSKRPIDGVPSSIADRVDAVFTNEIEYLEAVSALSSYGLVTIIDRDATVHRLIQAATRDSTEPLGADTDWASAAAALLLAAIPNLPANASSIASWLRLRPHVDHHLRITPVAESRLSLLLRHWSAQWMGEIGRPHEALTMFVDLLQDQTRILGRTHPDTLQSRHSQAQWTGEAGDFLAAVALFDEIANLWRTTGGPDHPEALRAVHSSAYWLGEAGDPIGACARLTDVLARRERILGNEDPDTLRTKHSLAYRIGQAGDFATACALLEELLPIRTRVLGQYHPHTLRTRYSLAQLLGHGGNPNRARKLTAELLVDQTRELGEDHPHTLRTRYNLAHWMGDMDDFELRRTELERLLEDQIRVLGSEHPDTRLTRQALENTEW